MGYSEVVVQRGVVPTEEDGHLHSPLAVPEAAALEELVVGEDLPADQVRVLLQPLFEHLDGVFLPPLVQQCISHLELICLIIITMKILSIAIVLLLLLPSTVLACTDPNCISCVSDPTVCKTCKPGFRASMGKCDPCD